MATNPVPNDQSLAAFIWAIGQQESSGNYNSPDSSSGAIGKYQLLPSNIVAWSKEMGSPVSVAQFRASPAIQDAVATFKLSQYVNKYGYAGAAAMWYSGQPNPNSSVGNPPVSTYVSQVLGRMANYPGGNLATGQLGLSNGGIVGTSFNPLNPTDWIKSFLGLIGVGDLKDMFERLGLILFGALFIFVGLYMMQAPLSNKAEDVGRKVFLSGGKGKAVAAAVGSEKKEKRQASNKEETETDMDTGSEEAMTEAAEA